MEETGIETGPQATRRKKVISLGLDPLTYEQAMQSVIDCGKRNVPGYVCFANVHMTIEAHESPEFAKNVEDATLVLPDGMPLVAALKLMYGLRQDRIAGMDAMPSLLKEAAANGLRVFFYGSTQDILDKICQRARLEFPNLQICGSYSPPFNVPPKDEEDVRRINNSNANLVFVALGCPKQEKWMARNSERIQAMLLGVGGAFPVYAGIQERAPGVMRNLGLEWLFRLKQEPRRLLGRYARTNSAFVYLLLKDLLRKRADKVDNKPT